MMGLPFPVRITILTLLIVHIQDSQTKKKLDLATFNKKAVGVSLKANGKQFFISSELCPGGIFLTRKVNENCLCYNGIFETVRECCSPKSTQIDTDSLEWKLDYKCGTTSSSNSPIRAILPLTKPHNRYGTIITLRSLSGKNVSEWRKYDTEDIIMKNSRKLVLHKQAEFEILNVKPLGREIRVRFGPETNTEVCYRGWVSSNRFQRIRVKSQGAATAPESTCCFYITKENTPGTVSSNCTSGSITTKLVDVPLADVDSLKCSEVVQNPKVHTLRKRNPEKFQRPSSPNFPQTITDDFIGDRGPLLVKRQAVAPMSPVKNLEDVSGGTKIHPGKASVILPRKRGISGMKFRKQAEAIVEFIAILRNDPNVEVREPETYRFKMLKKAIDVFLKVIPNNIFPHVMAKTAFDVFYFLYEELEPWLAKPPQMFDKVIEFLSNCEQIETVINFTTVGCPEEIDQVVIDPIIKTKLETFYAGKPQELEMALKSLKHVGIRKDKRFIPEVFDIYVEINWKVVDFVHSYCFEHFSTQFNAHNFFESELEKLFLFYQVQRRWFTRVEGLRYVRGIFSSSNLPLRMKQLDKIVTVGHSLSRYNGSFWLYRPNKGSVPWLYANPENAEDPDPKSAFNMEKNSGPRLAFTMNMLEEDNRHSSGEVKPAGNTMSSLNYPDRNPMYPYVLPKKLPAGELIWDGMAVCLHAKFSSQKRYFLDHELWGVNPSLQELGNLYPSGK